MMLTEKLAHLIAREARPENPRHIVDIFCEDFIADLMLALERRGALTAETLTYYLTEQPCEGPTGLQALLKGSETTADDTRPFAEEHNLILQWIKKNFDIEKLAELVGQPEPLTADEEVGPDEDIQCIAERSDLPDRPYAGAWFFSDRLLAKVDPRNNRVHLAKRLLESVFVELYRLGKLDAPTFRHYLFDAALQGPDSLGELLQGTVSHFLLSTNEEPSEGAREILEIARGSIPATDAELQHYISTYTP